MQPLKEKGEVPWYLLYQPIDFKIGNYYGSYEDIRKLCQIAKENNIRVIVDVVLNHVAGVESGQILPHEKVSKKLKKSEFYKINELINNWEDREQVIRKSIGVPCLRLENYEIQEMVLSFLKELIELGVGGFRFDAAKHIALPREGSDFWIRIKEELEKYDLFNYAEVIFAEKELLEEYMKYINVLTEENNINEEKSVSFVESHDSYLEFGYTTGLSNDEILKRYRELCKNKPNTLFYARPFDNSWQGEEIKDINRQKCNLH